MSYSNATNVCIQDLKSKRREFGSRSQLYRDTMAGARP